jgi:hypothetical protein
MIWKRFSSDSIFLWITLCIDCHEWGQSLDLQGFA